MDAFHRELILLLPRMRRFAAGLAGSTQDGEDLVQSAVERALRNPIQVGSVARLDSWAFRIIHNLWIDELRKRKVRGVPGELDDHFAGEDGRSVTAARMDLEDAVSVLDAIPADQRAVLCLVVLDGMSYGETAETLGIPVGTVMSRLARARRAVAQGLDGEKTRRGDNGTH